MLDVFLTHAWRNHDDWIRCVELLDSVQGFAWRNFSLPWYDPAFDPRTPIGLKMVTKSLEAQIAPVHCVVVLDSVYTTKSAQGWVTKQIEMARSYDKRIVGLPPYGQEALSDEVKALVDHPSTWEGKDLAMAIAGQ